MHGIRRGLRLCLHTAGLHRLSGSGAPLSGKNRLRGNVYPLREKNA